MARYPNAVWRPLPENQTHAPINPRILILHSAACNCSTLYYFFRYETAFESHFYVKTNGVVEQYMDTNVRADANRDANNYAISVETQDDGTPDDTPWSQAQVNAILDLARWAHRVHGIPLRRCDAPDGSGVGFHVMWGAPGPWTPVSKTCPGKARIRQFENTIIPALSAAPAPAPDVEDEDDMEKMFSVPPPEPGKPATEFCVPLPLRGGTVRFVADNQGEPTRPNGTTIRVAIGKENGWRFVKDGFFIPPTYRYTGVRFEAVDEVLAVQNRGPHALGVLISFDK